MPNFFKTRLAKEKVIQSENVFQGHFLKIQRDSVVLENGTKSTREFIKHPGASLVVPLIDAKTVVMIHQYRHAVGKVFLEFPAGKIDKNETPLQTAKRELKEETGFRAKKLTLMTHIHPAIGFADEKINLYLAQNLTQTTSAEDPDEILEVVYISIKNLKQWVWSDKITDVKTQIACHWLFKMLKQ